MRRARAIAIPVKRNWRWWLGAILTCIAGGGCQPDEPRVKQINNPAPPSVLNLDLPRSPDNGLNGLPTKGNLEVVALFEAGPMPTGVAVSEYLDRKFVCFPRWADNVQFTVGEIVQGEVKAYPNLEYNKLDTSHANTTLVSVQSVVVDATGKRLWLLDTGSINFQTVVAGGPKLIAIDLATNKVVKQINFPTDVALPTTYLNDVRFDLKRGKEGTAYITDSSAFGDSGIIIVDIASGKSWRKLHRDPSVLADTSFTPVVEGKPLKLKPIGSDGISLSADGEKLYYSPLASHRWYSVNTDALADPKSTDAAVRQTIKEMPPRDFASDGLEGDAQGNVYLTDYEHNAIRRYSPATNVTDLVVADPRLIWPDSMSIGTDGYLYVTANQLNRQASYQNGMDKRQRPFVLFRIKTDSSPVRATPAGGAR